jgi:hypothetical protein
MQVLATGSDPRHRAPTASVKRTPAYIYPRELTKITELLQLHGIEVHELREDIELDLETYTIDAVTKAMRPFQGHEMVDVKVATTLARERLNAGAMVVRTNQPLGVLASYLLEPHAADGLTSWNFFDDSLTLGATFPVFADEDGETNGGSISTLMLFNGAMSDAEVGALGGPQAAVPEPASLATLAVAATLLARRRR